MIFNRKFPMKMKYRGLEIGGLNISKIILKFARVMWKILKATI